MLKNHKLAKSIADASWSSFCNMIDYKSKELERIYLKINTFYPSSKLCHCCGYKYNPKDYNDITWNENIREWICNNCGTYLDRDENAALNILKEGLRILKCRNTDGRSGSDKSLKPVDTGLVTNLEQESVIVSCFTTCHAEKSSVKTV